MISKKQLKQFPKFPKAPKLPKPACKTLKRYDDDIKKMNEFLHFARDDTSQGPPYVSLYSSHFLVD